MTRMSTARCKCLPSDEPRTKKTAKQELVRALYRRPGLAEALREPDEARPGLPDLAALLAWLWPLTAAPQRHLRVDAQWLATHLAPLALAAGDAPAAGVCMHAFTFCGFQAISLILCRNITVFR